MHSIISYAKLYEILRKLAKNNYWQTLYAQSKETFGLNLFNNSKDFTDVQVEFLNELGFYHGLMTDIYMGDVSELVLNSTIYEDSYQYYKTQKRKKELYKKVQEDVHPDTKYHKEGNIVNQNQWVFTKIKGKK